MKKQFFLLNAVLSLAACSSPKYAYKFDTYDYNSGRKKSEKTSIHYEPNSETSPLALTEKNITASVAPTVPSIEKPVVSSSTFTEKSERYEDMSKDERKDFRRGLKKQIKNYVEEIKSGNSAESISATKELDDELKLAIIFGAIGITLTILGGINTVFWVLGVVGLVIGLVFFIRWISTQ
ncbi:MAG: hypothetical protein C0490_14450 [Marivirga sp.]|nr:hypothetical protein [Marivirga sp.]